jgi:hypothetical protein
MKKVAIAVAAILWASIANSQGVNPASATTAQKMAYLDTSSFDAAPRYEEMLTRLSRKFPESKDTIANMTVKTQELLRQDDAVTMNLYDIMAVTDDVIDHATKESYAVVAAIYVRLRESQNHAQAVDTMKALERFGS